MKQLALLIATLGLCLACEAQTTTATFDFDTGTPALTAHQGLPPVQNANGVTAFFTGSFSVQNDASSGYALSMFSGLYLVAQVSYATLDIRLSQFVTNITFPFATADFSPTDIPSTIQLFAYTNSATTPSVGSVIQRSVYGTAGDAMPMGTLTFSSAVPFNLVHLQMGPGSLATYFLVDTITVQTVGGPTCAITASASPAAGGKTIGDATYTIGSTATVVATANANYAFINWTDGGVPVTNTASYSFTASANRDLVANFVPVYTITVSPSLAAGGTTSGGGKYNSTSNVTVIATAKPNYAFVNWTEGGVPVSTAMSYSFSASANRTLVANFVRTYSITTSSSPAYGGTTIGGGVYLTDSNATVVATPNAGYAFVNWTEGTTSVTNLASYSFTVSSARTLVANFVPTTYPKLTVLCTRTNTALICWPGPSTGFRLQETPVLGRTNASVWADTTNAVDGTTGTNQIILSSPKSNCFYRLYFHP